MKVLLVNKFLYRKGGSETYVFKLGEILESHGHEVQYFGLKDKNNIVGNAANSYVTPLDLKKNNLRSFFAGLKIVYSFESRRKIRKVLEEMKPDVVHLNNIQFHLTPSIILEIHKWSKKNNHPCKIVSTSHDYQLICPSHGLFDSNYNICEKCLKGNYFPCLKTKCIKKSYLKSLIGVIDAYFWKFNKAYDLIDTIICPSYFMKSKLDTSPRLKNKTVAIHNFTVIERETNKIEKEDYILEFGHLSKDKGTLTLLEVAKRLPDIKFVFAGYGPAEEEIKKVPNAEYVGFKTGDALKNLIEKAKITVCPSEEYENCPFTVIESQLYQTPVIGSRMGGIPELIDENCTGKLYEAGNIDELELCIKELWYNPELLEQYISNCRTKEFETMDTYYEKIIQIYKK